MNNYMNGDIKEIVFLKQVNVNGKTTNLFHIQVPEERMGQDFKLVPTPLEFREYIGDTNGKL